MPSKKNETKSKKKSSKGSKKKAIKTSNSLKFHFYRGGIAIFLLLAIIFTAGFLAHYLIPASKEDIHKAQIRKQEHHAQRIQQRKIIPEFEIYPKNMKQRKPLASSKLEFEKLGKPKIALIIDDLGYDIKVAKKWMHVNENITLSLLPLRVTSSKIADFAHKTGIEIMLHLPMEPNEYPKINPGPGALLSSMSHKEIVQELKSDFSYVPYIKGVNNHMGSKLTTDFEIMSVIFKELKLKKLFFLDSRTSAETVCARVAKQVELPFIERDIFIDHLPNETFIRNQLNELVKRANEKGYAIGIGHPHHVTLKVVEKMLPTILKTVQLVPISKIIGYIT